MADGSRKPISQVKVGDAVLATDPKTGERGPRKVTHLWVHTDTLLELEVDGGVLTTTEDHPFWNATDREYQRADQVGPGDRLLSADGQLIRVMSLRGSSQRVAAAYNLTVDDIHTYYVVAGDTPVLVHNSCGPEIGTKLEYFFGNATGNAHNIQRSGDMASQLNRIGIGDSAGGRALFSAHLNEVFHNPNSVVRVQENGRTVRDGLLIGPGGMLKTETIWDGNKLITGQLYGSNSRYGR
ncbi:polymorphic toxin-type HINT domain-containing protein [Kribbella sp. NPDC023855]|uniref:polymorphic toxin-type HINT domain-containing protein n=1 Tax=Kribbella sp. NPDC023855 TaxID=3154698 RepID=UPI0033EFC96A